jgi:hypothetical protein
LEYICCPHRKITYWRGQHIFIVGASEFFLRSASLRAGLRRKELIYLLLNAALKGRSTTTIPLGLLRNYDG